MLKDLSAYLTPNLEIPLNGKTYSVAPPTKEDGLRLAALIATLSNYANGKETDDPETKAIFEAIPPDTTVAQLALGQAVYEQMIDDKVPGSHIDDVGRYAMYYWVFGEEKADQITADLHASKTAEAPGPKGSKGRKTGPRTGSVSQTRTASTPGTDSRPATSDHKPPRSKAKAPESPGTES